MFPREFRYGRSQLLYNVSLDISSQKPQYLTLLKMMSDFKSAVSPECKRSDDSISESLSVLNELRLNGKLCDARLRVRNAVYPIHRAILACCSPFFYALFTNGMQETEQKEVEINDVSVQTIASVIEYAYTHKITVHQSNVEELMVTGDKFGISGIVNLCHDAIISYLTPGNAFHYHSFATAYEFCILHTHVKRYIRVHFEDIGLTNYDILDLSAEELQDILSGDNLNVRHEEFVFLTLVRWVDHEPSNRVNYISTLIPCVRLGLVTREFFELRVVPNKYLWDNIDVRTMLENTRIYLHELERSGKEDTDLDDFLVRPRIPNEVLFAVGGWSGGGPITLFESYDSRSDRWYPQSTVDRTPRAYHGLASVGNKVYMVGGFDGTSYFSSVRCFDPVTERWTEAAPMHYQRCYVSVCAVDGFVYACGGYNGRQRQKTAERYDPQRNQWTLIAKMHLARSDASAAALAGKVYIAGGFNGQECLHSAEVYDPLTDDWTMVAPMRKARSGVCLVAYNDAIYALGGFNGARRQACGERYDPERRVWTPVRKMFTPRSNFAAVVLEKMIYVVGGFNGSTTIRHVECYDAETEEWTAVHDMSMNRSALSACVVTDIANMAAYTYHGAANRAAGDPEWTSDEDDNEEEDEVDEDDDEDEEDEYDL